jgi:hypothetical protein
MADTSIYRIDIAKDADRPERYRWRIFEDLKLRDNSLHSFATKREAQSAKGRYSPAECTGIIKTRVIGEPDMKHVSTSYAERNNLNIRMHSRRMTRLTNAFSKKMENHAHAMALHFLYYNFVRIHKTLKVTPAMAAGVTDRLWEVADMVGVLEAWEAAKYP